mgnify:CR=1 FL=1
MNEDEADALDPTEAQIAALLALVHARRGLSVRANREHWCELRVVGGRIVEASGSVGDEGERVVALDPREVWRHARAVAFEAAGFHGPPRPGRMSAARVLAHFTPR